MAFFHGCTAARQSSLAGVSSTVDCLCILMFVKITTADNYSGALMKEIDFILYMYRPQKGGHGAVHAVKMQIKQTPKCQMMDKLFRGIKPECSSMIYIHINFHFS